MYPDIYPTLPVRLSPGRYSTRGLHGYYPDMYPPNTVGKSISIFGKYPPPPMNGKCFVVNIRERSEKETITWQD
jgi:hypothetical protein